MRAAKADPVLSLRWPVGNWFEPNSEAILALNDDLIVLSEETYQSLHKDAATVTFHMDNKVLDWLHVKLMDRVTEYRF